MSLFRNTGAGEPASRPGPFDRNGADGRVAVVDIGSSSLRLVVYDTPAHLPVPIFNEKADCGLARGLEFSGKLNQEGVKHARDVLARFVRLAKIMEVERLELIATAAVRDAADGLKFVEEIESTFNVTVQVLSGAEEARLSALGLLSGVPEADGLLGDMGGGSLDLIALDKGHFGANATFPLGHLRLPDAVGNDIGRAAAHVDAMLEPHDWLTDIRGRTLFAVGGSWRSLARIFIEQTNYPIHIIDRFTMSFSEIKNLAELIGGLSSESLKQMASVPRKRIETLPYAAVAMAGLLKIARPRQVVFSGFGMREGQMLKGLPPDIRSQDPLIAGCESLAARTGRFTVSGREMRNWMTPLFANETASQERLRYVACLLSDIGWTEHPDYRAEHSFYRVLRLPYAGLSHRDRAYLAKAIFVRYNGNPDEGIAAPIGLLDESDRKHARAVGLALRLAHTISGSAPGLIDQTKLKLVKGAMVLMLPASERQVFLGDAVERRMQTLAKALGFKRAEFGKV